MTIGIMKSWINRVTKVGKDLQDCQVQPLGILESRDFSIMELWENEIIEP